MKEYFKICIKLLKFFTIIKQYLQIYQIVTTEDTFSIDRDYKKSSELKYETENIYRIAWEKPLRIGDR